ncbi:MAG: NUDIX hydrolase [Ignavibacteriales bacterium]|nr:NUDIX hydrolase [Ignavibacteriales bacterium]
MQKLPLKILKSETRYTGKVFDLIVDEIEYPSGNRGIREVARHPGGAVVVPMLDDSTLLLIRQFRYPTREMLYEVPAGKLNEGEDPLQCAKRELEEETGFTATSFRKLTAIYTTPGFCNEQLHLYLATGLTETDHGQQLEEGEQNLTLERVPFARAITMIESGAIVDSKTICGILLAERVLRKS